MSDTVKTEPASRADVLLAVRELIAQRLELEVDEVQPDDVLFELPGMDSLRLMHGMLLVEQRFGVTVDTNKAITVQSVEQLADLLVDTINGDQS
ncbi:acyl carrier protein [Nocardia sp. NPDC051052]|uniref:acyl carrier protein n=1 Tax=Nocardia sp. NPDC051052 TaxID=3364322 RepID=UPI003793D527